MHLRLHRFDQHNNLIMLGVEGTGFEPDLIVSIPPGLAINNYASDIDNSRATLLEGTQGSWRLRPLVNELMHTWTVRGHALITLSYIQTRIWRIVVGITAGCEEHEEPRTRLLAFTFDLPGYNPGWNGNNPPVPPEGAVTEEQQLEALTRFERPWVI